MPRLPLLLTATGLLAAAAGAAPEPLRILPSAGDPTRVQVALEGEPAARLREWLRREGEGRAEEVFSLALKKPGSRPPAPILARLSWSDSGPKCTLEPQASLTRGLTYQARFDGPRVAAGLAHLVREYRVPQDTRPSEARVTRVFPAQATVPANLLKFYVHFSRPMAEGSVFRNVRLIDGAGRPVAQAFNERELWADDHRRLTLWINPGRTKRSLGLSESLGPVLEPGRRYTLEVGAGLPDQQGRPLGTAFRHGFLTGPHDRAQPRIADWRLAPAPAGSRQPLRVAFPEPLDHALAARGIRVEAEGRTVAGAVTVSPDGRSWSFRPARPWSPGRYRLVADGELEDLAGNSLYRPFESPAGGGRQPVANPPEFRREFLVSAASKAP